MEERDKKFPGERTSEWAGKNTHAHRLNERENFTKKWEEEKKNIKYYAHYKRTFISYNIYNRIHNEKLN